MRASERPPKPAPRRLSASAPAAQQVGAGVGEVVGQELV
nr:hypothetical protein JVH1_6844 [Rhodococcus sp. JVH1]